MRRGRVTKAEARVPRAIRTMIAHVHADRLHYALLGTPNRYSLPQTQEGVLLHAAVAHAGPRAASLVGGGVIDFIGVIE